MSLLRTIIIGIFFLTLVTLWIFFSLATKKIYEQRKKAEKVKEKKIKEKKIKEEKVKEKRLVNPDIVSALQRLGFNRQESITAAQKAVEKLGDVEIEKLIKEALQQILGKQPLSKKIQHLSSFKSIL